MQQMSSNSSDRFCTRSTSGCDLAARGVTVLRARAVVARLRARTRIRLAAVPDHEQAAARGLAFDCRNAASSPNLVPRAQLRPRSGTRARAVASSRAAPLTAPSTPRSWSGATRWSRSGAPSLEMLGTFAAVGAAWLHLALFCATLGALSHARGSPFAANIRARRAPRCPTLAFGILGAAGAGGGAAASFSPPRRRLFPVRRHSVRSPQKRAPMLAGLQTVRA